MMYLVSDKNCYAVVIQMNKNMLYREEQQAKQPINCQFVHHLLCQKYSGQPRRNYQSRQFQEYIRPIVQPQPPTNPQLQCLEFLMYTTHKEHLLTYHTLQRIYLSITYVILNSARSNQSFLPHFYDHRVYVRLRKYQIYLTHHRPLISAYYSIKNGSPHQFSSQKCSAGAMQVHQESEVESQDREVRTLERINKDLTNMLQKLNKNELQQGLSAYLRQIKHKIPKNLDKTQKNIYPKSRSWKKEIEIKGQRVEDSTIELNQMEEESYGLSQIKGKQQCSLKKRVTFLSRTETIRKKVLKKEQNIAENETPKRQYIPHHCSVDQLNTGKTFKSEKKVYRKNKHKSKKKQEKVMKKKRKETMIQ